VLSGCGGVAVTVPAQAQALPVASVANAHAEVALHARSVRASARAERAAWLTLTLPLDRLALPRVSQQQLVVPAATSTPSPSPSPSSSSPAGPPGAPAPLVSFAQLRALTEFSRRATAVALSVAGTAAERRRLDSLASRARSSALLPEMRLRAVRNTDHALRWVPTADDPTRVTQADGAGLILEASATFRLDRLLFASEELAIERVRQDASEARLKLEARVQSALLGLFRAHQLGCAGQPDDPKTTLELVKGFELFEELDNLTAGWFSDQAAGFGRAIWGFPEAVLGICSEPLPPSAPSATNPVASLENSE
jgi:hypothetical protein